MKKTIDLKTETTRTEWSKTHTLTPVQRNQVIAQKLERAVKQFQVEAKIKTLA